MADKNAKQFRTNCIFRREENQLFKDLEGDYELPVKYLFEEHGKDACRLNTIIVMFDDSTVGWNLNKKKKISFNLKDKIFGLKKDEIDFIY